MKISRKTTKDQSSSHPSLLIREELLTIVIHFKSAVKVALGNEKKLRSLTQVFLVFMNRKYQIYNQKTVRTKLV